MNQPATAAVFLALLLALYTLPAWRLRISALVFLLLAAYAALRRNHRRACQPQAYDPRVPVDSATLLDSVGVTLTLEFVRLILAFKDLRRIANDPARAAHRATLRHQEATLSTRLAKFEHIHSTSSRAGTPDALHVVAERDALRASRNAVRDALLVADIAQAERQGEASAAEDALLAAAVPRLRARMAHLVAEEAELRAGGVSSWAAMRRLRVVAAQLRLVRIRLRRVGSSWQPERPVTARLESSNRRSAPLPSPTRPPPPSAPAAPARTAGTARCEESASRLASHPSAQARDVQTSSQSSGALQLGERQAIGMGVAERVGASVARNEQRTNGEEDSRGDDVAKGARRVSGQDDGRRRSTIFGWLRQGRSSRRASGKACAPVAGRVGEASTSPAVQGASRVKPTCVICLDDVEMRDAVALQCAHVYHKKCSMEWSRHGSGCPACGDRLYGPQTAN